MFDRADLWRRSFRSDVLRTRVTLTKVSTRCQLQTFTKGYLLLKPDLKCVTQELTTILIVTRVTVGYCNLGNLHHSAHH
jgi:hypothetical protein